MDRADDESMGEDIIRNQEATGDLEVHGEGPAENNGIRNQVATGIQEANGEGPTEDKRSSKKKKKNTKGRGVARILLSMFLLYLFMFSYAIIGLLMADFLGFSPEAEDVVIEIFGNIGIGITAFLVCKMVKSETGERLSQVIKIRRFHFGFLIVLVLTAWSLSEVCDHLMGRMLSQFMSITPDEMDYVGIISIVSAVVCAPILEEIIFRFGFIGLLKKNSSMAFALIFTTLVFAAAHSYNIQNSVDIFVGTFLTAYVYYKTENLLYTIGEHAIHNALCFLPFGSMSFGGSPIYYMENGFIISCTPWFLLNLGILIAGGAWLIWFFIKHPNMGCDRAEEAVPEGGAR